MLLWQNLIECELRAIERDTMNDRCDKNRRTFKMTAIMPNYNGAHFLAKSIQSLLKQTEAFDEIIIIDDGSVDHSIAVIDSFMKANAHIRLVKHDTNQGVNIACNTGLAHATGDYVVFCAVDDWFSPGIVRCAKKIAQEFPGIGIICGDGVIQRFDCKRSFYRMLPFRANTFLSPDEFKAIACKSYVGFNSAGGMFMCRRAILQAGMIHSTAYWHADWLLYFIIALRHGIYYCNEVFIHVNLREASYSEGKKNNKIQNRVMLGIIHIIAKHYPDLWDDFRQAALIPHHALRYIPLLWLDPLGRKFMTKRLIWKVLINNHLVVRASRLFPYSLVLKIRKLAKA